MTKQRTLGKLLGFLIVGGGGIIMMFPLLWLISSSLKAPTKYMSFPSIDSRPGAVVELHRSLFGCARAALYTEHLADYGFCDHRHGLEFDHRGLCLWATAFKGRDLIFSALLATLMLPYVVIMIPVYVMFSKIGWINTLLPLIVPSYFGDAFFIFLLRQFFRTIPMELEDAARIDGASRLRSLFQIIAPLARPAIIVVTIQSILGEWNAFMQPLIFLTKRSVFTLALGLNSLQRFETGRDWTHYMMVLGVFMVVPVMILYFIAQRKLIEGIVMTGLKKA